MFTSAVKTTLFGSCQHPIRETGSEAIKSNPNYVMDLFLWRINNAQKKQVVYQLQLYTLKNIFTKE